MAAVCQQKYLPLFLSVKLVFACWQNRLQDCGVSVWCFQVGGGRVLLQLGKRERKRKMFLADNWRMGYFLHRVTTCRDTFCIVLLLAGIAYV